MGRWPPEAAYYPAGDLLLLFPLVVVVVIRRLAPYLEYKEAEIESGRLDGGDDENEAASSPTPLGSFSRTNNTSL